MWRGDLTPTSCFSRDLLPSDFRWVQPLGAISSTTVGGEGSAYFFLPVLPASDFQFSGWLCVSSSTPSTVPAVWPLPYGSPSCCCPYRVPSTPLLGPWQPLRNFTLNPSVAYLCFLQRQWLRESIRSSPGRSNLGRQKCTCKCPAVGGSTAICRSVCLGHQSQQTWQWHKTHKGLDHRKPRGSHWEFYLIFRTILKDMSWVWHNQICI